MFELYFNGSQTGVVKGVLVHLEPHLTKKGAQSHAQEIAVRRKTERKL